MVRSVREYRELLRTLDRCGVRGHTSAEVHTPHADWNVTKAQLDQIARSAQVSQSQLIRRHLPLVVSIAKAHGRGVPFADVLQEGTLGLLCAAERFDPNRGCRFSTYATWWIRQRVSSYVSSNSRMIRLPGNVVVLLCKKDRAKNALRMELGREPTMGELAVECDVAPETLRRACAMSAVVFSMERKVERLGAQAERLGLVDGVPAPDPSPEDVSHQNQLRDTIEGLMGTTLTSREIEVVKLRFGLGETGPRSVEEVGVEVRASGSQVRTIEARALNKLRRPSQWQRVATTGGALGGALSELTIPPSLSGGPPATR